jgi:hypothetical protein
MWKMGLVQTKVNIKVTDYNIQHYLALGYDAKNGYELEINTEDLSVGSGCKIDVQCDYCGKIFKKAFRRYLETKDDLCCTDCRPKKFAKTNIKKFGCECSLRNPEINKKVKETWMRNYGVNSPLESKEILKKIEETCIKKYGAPTRKLTQEDISNISRKQNKNNKTTTSAEQLQLHSLYGGILNYKIGLNYIDIFLENENICCEYNGGGHYLSVIHNRITQEKFDKKEIEKYKKLVIMGFKCFIIVNKKHGLPNNEELLKIKERAINTLKNDIDVFIYDMQNKSENLLKINDL